MKAPLADAMLTPWRATRASRRWFALAIMALCILGAVAIGVFMPGPRRWLACIILYAVGAFLLWALWLSATLLLAIDARRLGLPRVQRTAIHGLIGYAALTVGLPVAALHALPNADSALATLIVTSAAAGGLAFVLLPGYVVSLACLLPAVYSSLKQALPLPNLPAPGWQAGSAYTLVVMAAVVALRWRQLVRGGADHASGLRRPLVMQFHRLDTDGFLGSDPDAGNVQMIRRRPNWLQPRAALRDAGPRSPVLALRIALGGHYLPRTLASHLRLTAIALLQIVALGLVNTLLLTDRHGMTWLQANPSRVALAYIGGICALAGPALALLIGAQLQQRWQRSNAELPLLALLPGLGDAEARRRHLLHATLDGPAVTLAGAVAVVLGTALALHLRGSGLLLVALPPLASLGVLAMLALRTYGGLPWPTWAALLLFSALLALLALSLLLPILSIVIHATFASAEAWLLLAWGGAALVLAWLGRRGWLALKHRPHPFLPAA